MARSRSGGDGRLRDMHRLRVLRRSRRFRRGDGGHSSGRTGIFDSGRTGIFDSGRTGIFDSGHPVNAVILRRLAHLRAGRKDAALHKFRRPGRELRRHFRNKSRCFCVG